MMTSLPSSRNGPIQALSCSRLATTLPCVSTAPLDKPVVPPVYCRNAMSPGRSEEHTSELQSLMRISYAVFCLKKKNINKTYNTHMKYTTYKKKETEERHKNDSTKQKKERS